MNVSDYLLMLRKRWRVLTVFIVAGLGVALAVNSFTTPIYSAHAQLFVSTSAAAASDTSGLNQGGQFAQQRVKSYADIINSAEVIQPVIDKLELDVTAEQLADQISASAPLDTVLINLTVRDRSASRARAIANAVAEEFTHFATSLETPIDGGPSPVKVSVVQSADLPASPVTPRVILNVILGLLLGLAVGVGVAVLRETLDTSIRNPDQLQRDFALPMLGVIGFDSDARKRPLIVQADPRSPRAEAFRQLRTNLQFVDIDHAPRSILVTSSIPDEGKTTTATNLAIALAQSGMRVLLVEADLRRPKISDYLGIESAVGLTSVLVGRAQLDEAVQTWGSEGELKVLPSGPTPPNPSELLGSQAMTDLIHELELGYDLVLIDAPPLLPVTDAAVIATSTSGALVVVRHGHCRREQLARAVQSLRAVDASIYGAVLTMTPAKGAESVYYYGQSYRQANGEDTREEPTLVTPVPRTARVEGRHSAASPYPNASSVEPNSVGMAVTRLNNNEPYSPAASLGEDPLEFFER